MKFEIQNNGRAIVIITIHAPGEDADRKIKEDFYRKINNVEMYIREDSEICMLGDLNARTGHRGNNSAQR